MKRFGFVATLFVIAFLFTQCRCDDPCGCGKSKNTTPAKTLAGISNLSTNFVGDSFLPEIELQGNNVYVQQKTSFSFISSAYACSPERESINYSTWIDSIQVISIPVYNGRPITEQLYDIDSYGSSFNNNIASFNNGISRGLVGFDREPVLLGLAEPPTQSDSFTFSFYYYKDGAIIDSSFTQKHFISSQ